MVIGEVEIDSILSGLAVHVSQKWRDHGRQVVRDPREAPEYGNLPPWLHRTTLKLQDKNHETLERRRGVGDAQKESSVESQLSPSSVSSSVPIEDRSDGSETIFKH